MGKTTACQTYHLYDALDLAQWALAWFPEFIPVTQNPVS